MRLVATLHYSPPDLIGTTLDGRYEIIRLLGQGGMGAVYEAKQAQTGERVAIKLISVQPRSRRGQDSDPIRRFHREAKATASIQTEHIVHVLDTGTDPATNLPYIVMEYLEGEDIEQALARLGPLPPTVALRIAAQACRGLAGAHEARVVHRDIKPANLFLARRDDGEIVVKLLDFGIAKIKPGPGQGAPTHLTVTGSMLGSPLYMSPEQVENTKLIDHRTDIWSLGVVLYAMLAGRAPHEDIPTIGKMLVVLCTELPRPVQELAPWVPPEMAEVVHRALRFEPDSRFQSAANMLEAITALLPDGTALRQEELSALTDEDRRAVAPKLKMAGVTTNREARRVTTVPPPTPKPPPPESSAPPPAAKPRPRRRASRSRLGMPMAIGVALISGLSGYALYRVLAPAVTPEPPRHVPLTVLPGDASVDTGSAPAQGEGSRDPVPDPDRH